jgi:hypothetical protein
MEYESDQIKGNNGKQILINKDFYPHIQKIDAYASQHHVVLLVNQAYRDEKQKVRGAIVQPGTISNHQAGFALDMNIRYQGRTYTSSELKRSKFNKLPVDIQNFLNDIRKDQNLRWGGDFNTQDPVHIDHPINLISINMFKEYKSRCDIDYSARIPKWKFWR